VTGAWAMLWTMALLALAAWVAGVVLVPAGVAWCRARVRPNVQVRRLYLLAALPWFLPAAVIAAACVLAALKAMGWIYDHCPDHGPGHLHLCFVHWPTVELGLLAALVLFAAAAGLTVTLVRFIAREYTARARLKALRQLSRGTGRLRVLESPQPFALTTGVCDAVVLVSRGLLETLTPRERRAVVAHEVAHVRHLDVMHNLVLEVLLLLHPARNGRHLRRAWRRALEERADDAVAERFGGDVLAAALLKILRSSQREVYGACSVAGADPLRRVARLLEAPAQPRSAFLLEALYAAVLLGTATAVIALHHPLEHLLDTLVGL
jgi:Zn-dependent protease with chaperone function